MPFHILQQETIGGAAAYWAGSVPFNQFDPAAGDLVDAMITTAGTIDSFASIENLAPVPATIDLSVSAIIETTVPGLGVVSAVTPIASAVVNLGALQGPFDGNLNFGGPSGTVLPEISASRTQASVYQAGTSGTLPFVGTGTFDAGVSSYATSTVNGNGNLAVLLQSTSSATVSLEYDAASPQGGGGDDADSISILAGLPWLTGLPFANYVTTTPRIVTLPSQTSGWTGTASFARFNPALGTLTEIILNVGNTVAGTFSAENLETVAASISMSETASMTVTAPGFAAGVSSYAIEGDYLSLGAFDGAADFAGASGKSDTQIDQPPQPADWPNGYVFPYYDRSGSTTLSDSTDLSAFTGTGTISLPVSTAGTSTVTGPSNLLTELTQHTGGTVSVSYVYATPPLSNETSADTVSDTTHSASLGSAGALAAIAPGPSFIDAFPDGPTIVAKPRDTFVIAAGADVTIDDFSFTDGDKLNLSKLFAGVSLTSDLSNLGAFLSAASETADGSGGFDTTFSLNGVQGTARLTLDMSNPVAVADLLNNGALILPSH